MIYLLAATGPMYFEPVTYYTDKLKALGIANFLNELIDRDECDIQFEILEIIKNKHIKTITNNFFGKEIE